MQHVATHRYTILSANVAAGVAGPTLTVDGLKFTVQIHVAPANLFQVQTSHDGMLWANTIHEAAGAPAASTVLGVGTYEIISRGKYARLHVLQDGAAPPAQVFVGAISVYKEEE